MSLSQVSYIHTTRNGTFSLRSWAMLAEFRNPQQLDFMWREEAVKLLRQSERGQRILNKIIRLSLTERMAVFQKVKEDVSKDTHVVMLSAYDVLLVF